MRTRREKKESTEEREREGFVAKKKVMTRIDGKIIREE